MGIVTGAEYLKRMACLKSNVWMDGKRIERPLTDVEPFQSVFKAKGKLYDMVHDERYASTLQGKDQKN